MADDAIKVGGPYVENPDHVPNPADQTGQYNTSGLGAHQRIEEISNVYEVDKVQVAEQAIAALDPEDKSVPASRVILPDSGTTPEEARKHLTEAAKGRVEQGVVIGEPGPAERAAADETDGNARAEAQAEGKSVAPAKKAATTKSDEKKDEKKS